MFWDELFVVLVSANAFLAVVSLAVALLFPQRKPVELPEWTGRERKSLRADLEAAEQDVHRKGALFGSGLVMTSAARANTSKRYGLFPEALEAFMGESEPKEKIVRVPGNSKIVSVAEAEEGLKDARRAQIDVVRAEEAYRDAILEYQESLKTKKKK